MRISEPGKEYSRKIGSCKQSNKGSIMNILDKMGGEGEDNKLDNRNIIVFVLKARKNPQQTHERYEKFKNGRSACRYVIVTVFS